jgi:HIRAN domain
MGKDRPSKPRVSLTKAQLQDGIGAELFSLCQGMTADGELSKDEVVALGLWLRDNRDTPLPGIDLLSETLDRIVADGRITRDEERELMEAIEKVLPPDARKEAKVARKAVEARRKAEEKAAREQQRKQERAKEERRWPEDEFDFMVAGVQFEGRDRIVKRSLKAGDRVRLRPEPDNPHDDDAVAVTLLDGRRIGYVPRRDSADVSDCLDLDDLYVATVKKILTGGRVPVPVIVVQFYRRDQMGDVADLKPEPCPRAAPARKPWWKFW